MTELRIIAVRFKAAPDDKQNQAFASALCAMSAPHSPRQNHLLAALPETVYERLLPHLALVPMPLGQVLYTSGSELHHVYFPTSCIVSLVYVMANGASAEIAVTGYEGLLGVSLFLGGLTTPNQAVVQSGGHAYRISADLIKKEFDLGGPVQHLLLLYTQALIAQMAQTAVCNRHHSLDQQLCRWLLLSLDRLRSGELKMTQELIANMLDVTSRGPGSSFPMIPSAFAQSGVVTSQVWARATGLRANMGTGAKPMASAVGRAPAVAATAC